MRPEVSPIQGAPSGALGRLKSSSTGVVGNRPAGGPGGPATVSVPFQSLLASWVSITCASASTVARRV